MSKIAAIAASVTVIGLLGATFIVTRSDPNGDQFAQCRASAVAGGGDIGGPFELVNSNGETVTSAALIKQPTLIYFGYTFCPDVCPLDVQRNGIATEILDDKNVAIQPVFISIDPARDTPEIVGDYAANFHERMIGLTGTDEQVKTASDAYRTYYRKADEDPDYYLMDHSTISYLTLPKHGFVDFFRRDISPEAMAETIACFVDAA
jgi:protein SCO1/2